MSNLIIVSVDEDLEKLLENQSFVQIIPAQGIDLKKNNTIFYFTICSLNILTESHNPVWSQSEK